MYIRPHDDPLPVPTLEELAAARERELGAEKTGRRRPGSGKLQLDPRRDDLIKLLGETCLPVAEIHQLLAQVGVEVNLKTLFRYLRSELPNEYDAYLRRRGNLRRRRKPSSSATPSPESTVPEVSPTDPPSTQRKSRIGTPAAIREARNKDIDLDDYIE